MVNGCTESFKPETGEFQQLLVVEGLLREGSNPTVVRLSRTAPVFSDESFPESYAAVTIIDSQGTKHALKETSDGVYRSDTCEFQPIFDQKYVLDIVTLSGAHYASNEEVLKYNPPIDSIYYEAETRLTDIAGDTLSGLAFFLDTHDSTDLAKYYRWTYEEDWMTKVPWPKNFEVWKCYNHNEPADIILGNTRNLTEDFISKQELTFASTSESFRLHDLYIIKVRQYTMDEKGYYYWKELRLQSESQGSLYDPQPYPLQGNIFNTNDSDEIVLGYFEATSVQEATLKVVRKDIRYEPLDWPGWCQESEKATRCTDCRFHGGSTNLPDGWPR